MSTVEIIRHRAAIGGYLSDARSGDGIGGATVKLMAQAQQTQTRPDGFYYFLDLPDGLYTLLASAPILGSRYGTAQVADVSVASDPEGRPIFDPKANIGLPPTRLIGQVGRSVDGSPIPYANLRLRASNVKATATKEGQYTFSGAEAGTQTVHVSATGFAAIDQKVTLAAGQDHVVDFTLAPI